MGKLDKKHKDTDSDEPEELAPAEPEQDKEAEAPADAEVTTDEPAKQAADNPEPEEGDTASPAPEVVEAPAPTTAKQPWLKRLLRSRKAQIGIPAALLVLVGLLLFVEPLKLAALNLVTSGSAKFVVIDDTTLAPVTGVKVTVGSESGTTGKDGSLTMQKLKFGKQSYSVQKETYDTKNGTVTIRPGDNLVGPIKFHSQGYPVEVRAINKLSGEPVKDFEVSVASTNISARSNKEGVAVLKLPSNRLGKQALNITASGFHKLSPELLVDPAKKQAPLSVQLVREGKHYFLSNRDGKVGVYAANLDGSNQTLVIAGKTSTDAGATLSISPNRAYGALVSMRDGQRGPDGTTLPALYAINFEEKTIKRIDEGAPKFVTYGWVDDTTIFYTAQYDDYNRADNTKLKTANVTNAKLATIGVLPGYPTITFYREDPTHAYASLYDQTKPDYGLFSYNLSNKSRQHLLKEYAYGFGQAKPFVVSFKLENNSWRELNLKTQKVANANAADDATNSYIPAKDNKKMAWIEQRDGKGAVIIGDQNGENPRQVTRNLNVSGVLGWYTDDYLLFNSTTPDQSGDYIVHAATGVTTKISDVYRAQQRY